MIPPEIVSLALLQLIRVTPRTEVLPRLTSAQTKGLKTRHQNVVTSAKRVHFAAVAVGPCPRPGTSAVLGATRCPLDDEPVVWQSSGLQGRYANCFRVGHNAFEFVIDFGQATTNHQLAEVHTRIILNPAYSRTLLGLLVRSVDQYEQEHGAIAEDQET
jgi:hypothetical protein